MHTAGGGWGRGDQVDLLIVVSTIKLQGLLAHTQSDTCATNSTHHSLYVCMYVCMYSMGGVAASQVGVDHNNVKRLQLCGCPELLTSLKLGYSYRAQLGFSNTKDHNAFSIASSLKRT